MRRVPAAFVALLAWLAAGGAHAQAPTVLRDCPTCPELVAIPGGGFRMGSADDEAGREVDEGPVREVRLQPFALGRYHVTRAEFARFVEATRYSVEPGCERYVGNRWQLDANASWRNPGFRQSDRDPVVCVSWHDARAFLDWLSRGSGHTYRLPSEAEWERAARAGTTTARPWEGPETTACEYANVADIFAADTLNWPKLPGELFLCRDGFARTSPVGRFKPNGFGLHDMLGNAWQWLADCYVDSYRGARGDGRPALAEPCELRSVRGGSWYSVPRYVRSAARGRVAPDSRDDLTGFRVARDLR